MRYPRIFTLTVIQIAFISSISSADLANRYSFTIDASDSVRGMNATLVNEATISSGQVVFDGSNDYVRLPASSIAINTFSAITLEMWMTSSSVNAGKFTMAAAFGTRGSLGYDYLDFQPTRNDSNSARAGISNDTYGAEVYSSYTSQIYDDIEHHIVITVDNTYITLYVDGIAQSSVAMGSTTIAGLSNSAAYLARPVYSGDAHFAGSINEFRIYDSALTPAQIEQNKEWGTDVIASSNVVITETGSSTIIYTGGEGVTDTCQAQLAQQPTSTVVITVTPPAALNIGNGAGVTKTLTFTTSNWNTAQTITVAAAEPQTPQESTERITYTAASTDSNFNGINIYDTWVYIKKAECGVLGYLEADYNLDCYVNMSDFVLLSQIWLETDAPLDIYDLAGNWLKTSMLGETDVVNGPLAQSNSPYTIDTTQLTSIIDEKVYGHFLEHIYHSANGGLWGDLIWNRSFENSINQSTWFIDDDELVQTGAGTDITLRFGDTTWQNYEITLEAQKTGGSEGFLILFRADDNNYYWLNLGGWNNTVHAIEKCTSGSRGVVGSSISGSITTGQWYNIRIRCEDGNYQIWLDDTQLFDYTDSSPHTAGQIGVGTWSTQARFKNIQVTQIFDSSVLFAGLPTLPETSAISDYWTKYGDGQAALTSDALNGDYSVQLTASSGQTIGVEQTPFKLTTQNYSGSLWAKGSADGLLVQFMNGQTMLGQSILPAPTSTWQKYSFQITPSVEAIPGSLRISLIGQGSVYLDQVSMMGQDAIDTGGYRPDLLDAVAGLKAPVIRWPGGCYASAYYWKDGIGPQESRVKYPIALWEDQDTNSYGTDEFLQMCEKLNIEPILVINTGLLTGTCGVAIPSRLSDEQYVQDALDWMEYCNGPATSTWGAVRAANGHPEPYNVKYWEIDNETWSTNWNGGSTNYIAKVQEFVPVMKAYDPNIIVIACGGSSYDQSWNQAILDSCANIIDYISVHHYEGTSNYATGPISYENHIITLGNMIAASSNPNVKIFMSEWNLQSTDWRTGLYAGGLLNAFERQSEYLEIGTPALFLRHISASDWDNAFINFDYNGWFAAPNYIVIKLWHDHYAPYLIATTDGFSDLNAVATLSEDEKTMHFKVVNPTATERSMALVIDDSFVPTTAYLHYVAPGSLDSRNTLESTDTVKIQAKVIGINGQTIRFLLPAYSAGVVTVHSDE